MKALIGSIVSFLFVLSVGATCMGQSERLTATVEVSSSPQTQPGQQTAYLNGYCKAISGQKISYHSSHPDAEDALLVRARRDVHSISWETDTLPRSFPGTFYQFIWLAGIERKGWGEDTPEHQFKLYINHELWFTFMNRKDQTASRWTIPGKDGAELTFESRMTDKYGDLFGHMFMKLPKRSFQYGSPLVLRVEGEETDSPDWFMTFTYRFTFVPHCRPEPVLMRGNGKATQQLRISLDDLEEGHTAVISVGGKKVAQQKLEIGGNIVRVPIAAVTESRPMDITFIRHKAVIDRSSITISPVPKRDIYLLPYSHNDIGYTDIQINVERKQWANLDEALSLIRQTRDFPVESRFKWNMEILWPLDSYLRQATPEKKEEVLDAIRNGSIGLNALYVNPLTGLATGTEMAHLLDYAREFTQQHSVPISSATVSDIPGFTWGIVPALAQSGVKYFGSAPNSGDRIGYVIDQWGDKPFWWTSQSGHEKVLFWVAGSSYSSFHQGTLAQAGPDRIMKLGRKLIDTNYPYDMYYLPYTLGDNGGPDTTLSTFVKAWNEQYVTPTLIIATHDQMFKVFEDKYGATLPTFSGDFTPYWEDGAASSANETALNRHAVDRLIQAEALWSMYSPEKYPRQLADQAWREAVLWDEHTWGADKSVTDPDDPMTVGQWKIKQAFALKADSLSKALMAQVLGNAEAGSKREIALDIFNTDSWERSDLVILSPELSSIGDKVLDEKGLPLLSQRLTTGELAVLVDKVAPFSSKRIIVRKGNSSREGNARAERNTLTNGLLSLTVDQSTGAISSLSDTSLPTEPVDSKTGLGVGQYIYVPGKNPDSAQYLSNVRIAVKEKGPLVASLLVEGDAPGCDSFACEIRVIHNLHRIDMTNRLEKRAIRTPEGVHFAFPFNILNGILRYDVASGIVEPEKDQLPGSCKNFSSVVSWVDISNASMGVTWTTPDAPLIEIGAITAESPWMKTNPPSTSFFSYAMNNYWHTNYKADQSGPVEFKYSLFPHGAYDAVRATRQGREARQPLIVSSANSQRPGTASLLQVEPENILVESIKPLGTGRSWLLYLYNPSATVSDVQIVWNRTNEVRLSRCDASGLQVDSITTPFTLPAFGTQYIRVDETAR